MNSYLAWSKLHRRVRYELTVSGISTADLDLIGGLPPMQPFEAPGSYGDPQLVDLIAKRYRVTGDWIMPVAGASFGNFIALASVVRHGDCIGLESPAYDPLVRLAKFLGVQVVAIPRRASNDFAISLDDVHDAIKRGVRAVVITNLHNPTAHFTSREELARIVNVCADAGICVIVDEVYLDGRYLAGMNGRWSAIELGDNVIVVDSLTKLHGLSGLRLGWIAAHPSIIARAREVADVSSPVNSAPSMTIAIRAFERMAALEDRFRSIYAQGRSIMDAWQAQHLSSPRRPGSSAPSTERPVENLLQTYPHKGALFEWLRLPDGVHADVFARRLVEQYDTQIVPGTFFGDDQHIRVSLSPPPEILREGLSRILQCARDLSDLS